MRQASRRRAREQRARRAMLARTHAPDRCAFPGGCAFPADDGHELLSRGRGGSITDPFNVWPLCRAHHDWVGAHPTTAATLGLAHSLRTYTPVVEGSKVESVPATKPARVLLQVRISPEAHAWVKRLADEHDVSPAVVARCLLAVAGQHPGEVAMKVKSAKGIA